MSSGVCFAHQLLVSTQDLGFQSWKILASVLLPLRYCLSVIKCNIDGSKQCQRRGTFLGAESLGTRKVSLETNLLGSGERNVPTEEAKVSRYHLSQLSRFYCGLFSSWNSNDMKLLTWRSIYEDLKIILVHFRKLKILAWARRKVSFSSCLGSRNINSSDHSNDVSSKGSKQMHLSKM